MASLREASPPVDRRQTSDGRLLHPNTYDCTQDSSESVQEVSCEHHDTWWDMRGAKVGS